MTLAIIAPCATMPADAADSAIDGWTVSYNGGAQGSMTLDTNEYYSGGASVKIVNNSPAPGGVYIMPKTSVTIEAGKKYKVSAKVKSQKSTAVYFVITNSWVTQSITSVGSTFDWTNLQYTYIPEKGGTVSFGFIIEGQTEGLWFDEVKFVDVETGENLVKNSDFDDGAASVPSDSSSGADVADGTVLGIYNKIKSSDTFTLEEMQAARGAFKYMPMYAAEGITIDGDLSDWEDYPVLKMPVLPTQYQVYIKDGKPKDIEAECRFAQDVDNFYFAIAVTDDVRETYHEEETYWKGDSIQMTISTPDETYGNELGLVHNESTGQGEIFGNGFSEDSKALMELKTSQKGNVTYYEFRFPWAIKYWGTRPDVMLFNFLINDNDGEGRRYCAELAPGISEGKSNVEFPTLETLEGKKDWYGWIQGSRSGLTEDETKYEFYIVNEGEERTFKLTDSITGETEEITIPHNMGVRREHSTVYNAAGAHTVTAEISCDGDTVKSSYLSNISKKPASAETAQKIADKMRANAAVLEELLSKCEKAGISVDYERMNKNIIAQFADYIEEDITNEDLERVYYTEETTDELFEESKTALEAYLSGEKEAFSVPHYQTSKMRIDGMTTYATNEVDGEEEERPTFFVGWGHFGTSRAFVPVFNEWGFNCIQTEIAPQYVMKRSNKGWNMEMSKDPKCTYGQSGEEVHSGEKAIKVVYEDGMEANHYVTVYQNVEVTPGKTYELTGWVKAKNAEAYWISPDGWTSGAPHYYSGEHDWKQFSIDYKVPEGKTSINIRIAVERRAAALYFDDFSLKEKDTDKELLNDGGFETDFFDIDTYEFDESGIATLIDTLEKAEQNNIAVSVLISPHIFLDAYSKANGFQITTKGFMNWNINAPAGRAMMEKYIRELIPRIKDYTSLNNICLSNEAQFNVEDCGDFYREDWAKYLSEVYGGSIAALNLTYGTSYTAFSEVDFEHSVATPAKTYDYKKFNDKVLAEWHRWMADIIHELAPDIPLHDKKMGYTSSSNGRASLINNGTGYGEYYDFYDMHGSDYWNYEDDQYKPLVKNMWYDYQMSYGPQKPVINTEDHIIPDRSTNYNPEIADYTSQDIWQGAVHGRANNVGWVWQRYVAGGSTDFIGSILYRPDAISKIGRASMDLNRLAYEVTAVQKDEREVGIIYSDAATLDSSNTMGAMYEAYAAASFNGKRSIFINDYNKGMINSCKLLIVSGTDYITDGLLNAIKNYIANGGKVIVFGENSLKYNEHALPSNAETVNYIMSHSQVVPITATPTGFENPTSNEVNKIVRDALKSLGLYNVSVIDTATGEPANDVEYNVGVYDGKLIVNLSNVGDEKTLKIFAGDTQMKEGVELRSGEAVSDEITVGRYQAVLVRTDITKAMIDTYGHWAEDEIEGLRQKGIVNGVSETRFNPNGTITRAEFLALLTRAAGLGEASYDGSFSDVKAEDWFAANVAAARAKGIIGGRTFRPNDKITREEMCDMLVKCKEATGGALSAGTALTFKDAGDIANKTAVSKAVAAGLMNGNPDGTFKPRGNATRAESAAVISRYLNN